MRKGISGLIGLAAGLYLADKMLKPLKKQIKIPKIKKFKY